MEKTGIEHDKDWNRAWRRREQSMAKPGMEQNIGKCWNRALAKIGTEYWQRLEQSISKTGTHQGQDLNRELAKTGTENWQRLDQRMANIGTAHWQRLRQCILKKKLSLKVWRSSTSQISRNECFQN